MVTIENFVVGIVAGLVVYALNKFADRFLTGPRLKIVHRKGHFRHPAKINVLGRINCFTLTVTNESVYVAKGCKVYLIDHSSLVGHFDEAVSHPYYQLPWAFKSDEDAFKAVDMVKGLEQDFEVLGVVFEVEGDEKDIMRQGQTRDHLRGRIYDKIYVQIRNSSGTVSVVTLSTRAKNFTLKFIATAENCEPYYFDATLSIDLPNDFPRFQVLSSHGKWASNLLNMIDSMKQES